MRGTSLNSALERFSLERQKGFKLSIIASEIETSLSSTGKTDPWQRRGKRKKSIKESEETVAENKVCWSVASAQLMLECAPFPPRGFASQAVPGRAFGSMALSPGCLRRCTGNI